MAPPSPFHPALFVIDMQNDFCEGGALAVQGGLALGPMINSLLNLPFELKIASKDWHPTNHQSFASVHGKEPFSGISMTDPNNASLTKDTTLWPDHCVQSTHGAEFIPGLSESAFDLVVEKGTLPAIETYSCLADIFENKEAGFSADIGALLKEKGITHAFLVGLAGDFCVKYSALDLKKEGLETYVLEDGTEYVDPENGKRTTKEEWDKVGVKVVRSSQAEIGWVKGLK